MGVSKWIPYPQSGEFDGSKSTTADPPQDPDIITWKYNDIFQAVCDCLLQKALRPCWTERTVWYVLPLLELLLLLLDKEISREAAPLLLILLLLLLLRLLVEIGQEAAPLLLLLLLLHDEGTGQDASLLLLLLLSARSSCFRHHRGRYRSILLGASAWHTCRSRCTGRVKIALKVLC